MGTVTYFVTQSYVSGEIANESKSRSDQDISLDGRIKALEQTKNSVTSSLSSLETNINTLKYDIDFKIGTAPLDQYITFPSTYTGNRVDGSAYALTKARDLREGLNAISAILKGHMDTFDTATLNNVNTLNNQVTSYVADYEAQVSRIDAILALAPVAAIDGVDQTIDTFAEVVKLINQLKDSASNNAEFSAYQATINTQIAAKADLLQTIDTKTRYIDATTGTKYKLYITSGQLAIEDVIV